MGTESVILAKQAGYYSAGTCEFLVDENQNFYFLELNTRLQVEHPITESITGLDLLEHMIKIAADHTLEISQNDIKIKGHAIESRIYAEDPKTYLPSIGILNNYIEPSGECIRCDSGVSEGSDIPIYYDPLLAKVVTHSNSRAEAIGVMKSALETFLISGVKTNISLLYNIMTNDRYNRCDLSTNFLDIEYKNGFDGCETPHYFNDGRIY
jgi:propionyl-CoA carboxylase alpha chain